MDRYYPLEITVPEGTTPGNPLRTSVTLENNYLRDVEIVVPPGHVALTGLRVNMSGQQVIPWGNNSWIKADNYVRVFDVNTEIGIKTVSVDAYNTDFVAHTFYVRFHLVDLTTLESGTLSEVIGGTGLGGPGGIGPGGGGTDTGILPPPVVPVPPPPPPPTSPGGGGGDQNGPPPSANNPKTLLLWN